MQKPPKLEGRGKNRVIFILLFIVKIMKTKKRVRTQSAVMNWIEQQLGQDRRLAAQVEEILNEMRIEQDLVALRQRQRVSQSQLAKRLGVSQPAIAKIESGRARNLELRTLLQYATALGGKIKIEVSGGGS